MLRLRLEETGEPLPDGEESCDKMTVAAAVAGCGGVGWGNNEVIM